MASGKLVASSPGFPAFFRQPGDEARKLDRGAACMAPGYGSEYKRMRVYFKKVVMDTYLELDKQSVQLSRENEFVLYFACGRMLE